MILTLIAMVTIGLGALFSLVYFISGNIKMSTALLAVSLAGILLFAAMDWAIKECDKQITNSPEYREAMKKNAEVLDRFLSKEPMDKEEMWWSDQPIYYSDRRFLCGRLKQYRETFEKHLGPCPDTDRAWEKYFDERVWPALYEDIKVVYCPPAPPAAEVAL
jgi:hypothetical protein